MASTPKLIEFTPVASKQIQSTVNYIVKQFGRKAAEKFISKTERHLQNIAEGVIVNRFFLKEKQIRYFIVNRKNYVLYIEFKSAIRVIGIYGMAQDLESIKAILRKK